MEKMEMTRKEADITILKMLLVPFLTETGKDVRTCVEDMIRVHKEASTADIKCPVAMIWNKCNHKLVENFIEGYDKAIEKYGIDEANERLQEKLIETILKYEGGRTRSELIRKIKQLNAAADISSKIAVNGGIHLEQDEDGNYHEI